MALAEKLPLGPRTFDNLNGGIHGKRKALESLEHHSKLGRQRKGQNTPRVPDKEDEFNYVPEGKTLCGEEHSSQNHTGLGIYQEDSQQQWKMYVVQ